MATIADLIVNVEAQTGDLVAEINRAIAKIDSATWLSESEARLRLVAKIVALHPGGQQKIADAIGVHNSVISKVASGKAKMTPRIAAYLGLEMELQRVFRESGLR